MRIDIRIFKLQVVNDLVTECSVIGRTLALDEKLAEQASLIMTPDDALTKPIVARRITEAFSEIKSICRRYLIYGRDSDDNRLEKIDESTHTSETVAAKQSGTQCSISLMTGIPHRISINNEKEISVENERGEVVAKGTNLYFEYTPVSTAERLTLKCTADETQNVTVEYHWGEFGTLDLALNIPAYNTGVTDKLKSSAHRYIVDYTMSGILRPQLPEKAAEYFSFSETDKSEIRSALSARMIYGRRAADWS